MFTKRVVPEHDRATAKTAILAKLQHMILSPPATSDDHFVRPAATIRVRGIS